jgi:hypothetical protein
VILFYNYGKQTLVVSFLTHDFTDSNDVATFKINHQTSGGKRGCMHQLNFRSRRQIKGFGAKTIRYCNYSWFCRKLLHAALQTLPEHNEDERDCFVRGGE